MSFVGADPRLELREVIPRGKAMAQLMADVAKLDSGKQSGPWTRQILEWPAGLGARRVLSTKPGVSAGGGVSQ